MSTSAFNRRWAGVVLEAITRHGVRHVCIAPGSRSTPLTLEAAAHAKLTCHTHFDERGLGHMALGMAKALNQPVAVIVTSGTAVANLYPALIEAGLTKEKLVLLTADRPPELVDCGANQAIRQPGMFAEHPCVSLNLPRPTPDIPVRWLLSELDTAMHRQAQEGGAVHVNCPFAEPLYGNDTSLYQEWMQPVADWLGGDTPWLTFRHPQASVETDPHWDILCKRKGVIVAGQMAPEEGAAVAAWAQRLGWPLITDVQSGVSPMLPYADLWLSNPHALERLAEAEIVIQLGGRFISKRVCQWLESLCVQEYWVVAPHSERLDPYHHRSRRICAGIADWVRAHPAEGQRKPWAIELPALARFAHTQVQKHLGSKLCEASIAHHLNKILPPDGQVFLGNSLIVRLIDALGTLPENYPTYSNRGASGIDGLISTAAGVAKAGGKPTLAIVGDTSALYDLNSMALLRNLGVPFVLIVINNNGGAIFDLLPAPEAERERFYRMPHGLDFSHAAAMFGMAYARPYTWADVGTALRQAYVKNGAMLMELKVADSEGAETLRTLLQQVRDAVIS
ncbi:MAG: 2-succinyl-5-enolpyruvyl-6-hydroxy-3-cyclohexene-1-carboxylic-acid synthase [Plesiomonas sp.]|nr:2-succinyl-5-enolpyruvyl-6-hydroxy-3-cyclohexene-1-carboxylic-acid synthase [Plesiomonas sp.]